MNFICAGSDAWIALLRKSRKATSTIARPNNISTGMMAEQNSGLLKAIYLNYMYN